MVVLLHCFLFLLSAAVIWGLSGMLVSATDRVAKRYKKPGFAVAFLVLGIMTSIGEASVLVNATLEGVPQVSAGNLVGASLVIFLLIIPLLAMLGDGVPMNGSLRTRSLVLLLLIVALPSLLVLDGGLNPAEGLVMILLYFTLLYAVQKRKPAEEIIEQTIQQVGGELLHTRGFLHYRKATLVDIEKIVIAGVLIFLAGRLLVDESVYFSNLLSIPASLVGLILLSIGTNIPELVIAIRCVVGRHKDIAFGDYMGSAAANTLLMGFLALANGSFSLERSEFIPTFFLLSLGLALFFIFSRSKHNLSRKEGMTLLSIYAVFLIMQLSNVARFVGD
ncbi:hypothetical protein COU79_03040 [Candidatus Peregrinibacteria bacterium CG10_big_fil_rev_8_21_14_0_10_54_7]|nr:MAG: hypothetical protein COU79_03040 [Candidatus Peregrinibacteria bacterium CG10_big_fil_rev_8_21_14_0_10_54_7]